MSEAPRPAPVPPASGAITAVEVAALIVTLLWLAVVGWFFLAVTGGEGAAVRADPLSLMMSVMGIFLPVALIWVAAAAARTARTMREESARLQAAIDAMRLSYIESQEIAGHSLRSAMEERLEGVTRTQAVLGAEIAGLQADRPPEQKPERVLAPPARPEPPAQPALALDEDEPGAPLPPAEFIRALNFPDNDRDVEGFDVLRRALKHRPTAQLVASAQEVLTLLAQDGIYVDDFSPHRATPETWRVFAGGARGPSIAALGGVKDRSSLALCSARMKEDPVFRDAVHLFLRTFDKVFPDFVDVASGPEIARFADTRTARAFMLTGRVAGLFDG
ncbi:hypothetical protein [Jannaschia seohaensis]|uniref:Uncharacterized protein n=1 Tax=Jannaschia seohaensis TaxID=475081 RepID=A0A2Y9A867_9RHOB|nr:hypothetical protein [Jannaschia seohaensis]PWJ22471.1 hypothetical protein BCF38_101885 [Jannaschia seohaensis]SSA38749.1 hypothetical protein SAMN05421539_101885 [Jannaschia seohaensis]